MLQSVVQWGQNCYFIGNYICLFSCCCGQISHKEQLKGRGLNFGLDFKGSSLPWYRRLDSRSLKQVVTLHPQTGSRGCFVSGGHINVSA